MIIEVAIGLAPEPGSFRVEVVASPAGEASAVVELDADSLATRRGLLQQSVLASAVSGRGLRPEIEQPMREVGEALFTALLGTGEVAGRYRAAAAVAAVRGSGLRVALRIDTPALAALPWEAMYDRAVGSYVCRQDQLVRKIPVASVPEPLPARSPLRILGVVSSPRGLAALDVQKEQGQLRRSLSHLVSRGLAELHWAPSATWADLQELLLDGEWQVLHFIGHGHFDPGRGEGALALTQPDGRADLVAAHRVVDLLRQARPMPRLVVLNSCSGATTGANDLFSSTAATLVRGGVSAVAAMQYEISDAAATAFSRGFYAAIARGRGVDDAISSGRVAILGLSDQTLEWVTPVLYLRGDDSHLFAGSAEPAGDGPDVAGRRTAAPRPPRLAQILAGHTAYVTAVAFSPDGSQIATASGDRTARLWDSATGETRHVLRGHDDGVSAVAFGPDGSVLVTVGGDRTARLWDAASGRALRTAHTGHPAYLTGVALSPDGALLATVGWDPTVRLWDMASGRAWRILAGDDDGASRGVAFSPDGSLLAAAGDDGIARLWDVTSGAIVHALAGHRQPVTAVAFTPDGRMLATAGGDGTARLWDAATGAAVHVLAGHSDTVLGLAVSQDGKLLVTVGEDRTARLWAVDSGRQLSTVIAHAVSVPDVAFSPDGTHFATASGDGTARLWRR